MLEEKEENVKEEEGACGVKLDGSNESEEKYTGGRGEGGLVRRKEGRWVLEVSRKSEGRNRNQRLVI